MANLTYIKAITEALDIVLSEDDKTLIFGEDIGKNGGVFRTTIDLQEKHGEDRVFDTPLAESAIIGAAVGLAATGWRPIPEIQFMGFIFEAMDQIIGQLARNHYRFGGKMKMPVTIRTPFGGGTRTAEMHSDNFEAYFTSTPGLRVVTASNPYDAKGLLISSVESDDPVLFMENLRLYRSVKGEVPDGKYTVPLDKAKVTKEGSDVTIASYSFMANESLEAAKILADQGISAEVIDLVSLSPIDTETIFNSVAKTHHLVVAQEAQKMAGVSAQVVSAVAEQAIMQLDAPIGRVAAPDSIYPFALAEKIWMPGRTDIVAKVQEVLSY